MNPAPDRNPVPPHLNHTQLVAYQDGELSRAEMEAARAHLESCWPCRRRLTAVESSIEKFLKAREKGLPAPAVLSASRVEQFRERLARHAAEAAALPLSIGERLRAWSHRVRHGGQALLQPRRAALASLVVAGLLITLFSGVLKRQITADTVMSRAQDYEVSHLPAAGLMTRALVRVERIDRTSHAVKLLGTVVVVRDSAAPVEYLNVSLPSGAIENATVRDNTQTPEPLLAAALAGSGPEAPLLQYLETQRWTPDVSVAGFRNLVAGRGDTAAFTQRDGSSLEVHYPFAAGHRSGITEASLAVDDRDYSPTRVSIVGATRTTVWEYRFTRISFSSEPRAVELARVNVPAVTTTGSSAHASGTLPPHRVVPLNYAISRASNGEVEVAEALHRVDVCLGEEVNLFPMSDGSLLVQGLVDSSARREAIRQALKPVPGPLRIEVFVPRELKSGAELYPPPDQLGEKPAAAGAPSVRATLADLSSADMPLHDQLYRHFARPGAPAEEINKQVAAFSSEVVTLAQQTFLHAWALKRLDREFSGERVAGLSPTALQKVEQMRQDHRRWISSLARRQAEMLTEVLPASLTASVERVDDSRQDSQTLLRLAQEQNDLVRALFTTSQAAGETTSSLARLLAVLQRMGA